MQWREWSRHNPRAACDLDRVCRAVVIARQTGTGQECLDGAGAAAITGRSGNFVAARRGQRVVSPLTSDRIRPDEDLAVDDDSAAGPGADDHAKDDAAAGGRAVRRFGQREAVGVVGKANRAIQELRQILPERSSVQPG